MHQDSATALGNVRANNMVQQTLSVPTTATRGITTPATVDFATQNGWFVDFNPAVLPGERVNIDPQLYLGTLLVATNVPANNACTAGGYSWLYQFDYASGSFVSSASAVVATKNSSALIVGNVVVQLPSVP